jgi:hemoglobin
MTDGRARTDIASRDDVAALLGDFYGRAFHDQLLGPIFVDIAHMNLEPHLPEMCEFWETVLFRVGTYRGNPLRPHQLLHARAGLTPAHFVRWLTLWRATVDDRHAGPKAELAKLQAGRIAGAMSQPDNRPNAVRGGCPHASGLDTADVGGEPRVADRRCTISNAWPGHW